MLDRFTLKDNFNELVKLCSDSENTITVSSYLTGEKFFQQSNPRLLVIGRALNGWPLAFNDLEKWEKHNTIGTVLESRTLKSNEKVTAEDCKGLGWVNTYIKKSESSKRRYLTANTPFWKAAREATITVHPSLSEQSHDFYQYIAWTNLYKAAPQSGGNPSDALCKKQQKVCNDILRQEIQILNPTHILIIAKSNSTDKTRENLWIAPFEQVLREISKIEINGTRIKIVCIHRPEFQCWSSIKKEISALKNQETK
jgi:hypothetical protein